ncbi:MAG TPA: GNAT family protein [Chloroflexota bacterium]|nr:GNAT family protein [Chloroflexota bacterium]
MTQQQGLAIGPATLEGRWVRLEPLQRQHVDALAAISGDEEIWRYISMPLATHSDVATFVERALATAERGDEIPFVIIEKVTGTIVGSTRFMDIRREHRAVEIGSTWLGRAWWRTAINSESKYLLLRHLFDDVGCLRVSLKTDARNLRSQRAIERLGAVREGVLRKHMIVQNGYSRDTVYYSIIDTEWPAIRSTMERNLYGSPD